MSRFLIVLPVLPGKDARSVPAAFEGRQSEYAESRKRAGVTMERAYEQQTPMGALAIAYIESDRSFEETMAALASGDLPVDVAFRKAIKDTHGFDLTQPPAGSPPPEVVGQWWEPGVAERKKGHAFVAPLLPGKADAGRAFAKEAFVTRQAEFADSRRALGQTGEIVVLNSSPMGDLICVYLEGDDPVEANRRFAASTSPFDTWFKEQLTTLFPP